MQCAHEGCRCQAEDDYCSDYCREHAGSAEHAEGHSCGCGHDACTA